MRLGEMRGGRVDGYSREVAVRSGASEVSMINCLLTVLFSNRICGRMASERSILTA